jgi:hypothetical protein
MDLKDRLYLELIKEAAEEEMLLFHLGFLEVVYRL